MTKGLFKGVSIEGDRVTAAELRHLMGREVATAGGRMQSEAASEGVVATSASPAEFPVGGITLYVTPCPKPRMTKRDTWKKRPCVVRYRAFCDELRAAMGDRVLDPDKEWLIEFNLPMPKSWSKKKKAAMVGMPHQTTPDKDNLEKAFWDALMGQDKAVWSAWVKKFWSYEGFIRIRMI